MRATPLPILRAARVVLRPAEEADLEALVAIRAEPGVRRWWGPTDPAELRGELLAVADGEGVLAIEVEGAVAGAIQFAEEPDAQYRRASIDVYLGGAFQGRGLGREAIDLLVGYLLAERDHHRLTIDPAAANERAIRCYAAVGFRPVGTMREYERAEDGTWHDGLLMELLRSDRPGVSRAGG